MVMQNTDWAGQRPFPPLDFLDETKEQLANGMEPPIKLAPAPELKDWVVKSFLDTNSPLYNPDHDHITEMLEADDTFLAFAWATSSFKSKQMMILGQCEKVMFNVGGWRKARQEQQMREWFGFIPTYLITLDASFCENATDRNFCALIEHELYHIGVQRGDDGEVIYSIQTGLPKHYLASHDVEEFFGVVKRWGASESVKRLVKIAQNPPFVPDLDVSKCCGTCAI